METISGVPAHYAREYETIYIVRPDAGEEAANKVSGRIVETVDRLQGKLTQVQVWGRRRMAYKVRGHAKGVFIYLRYLGYPGLVEELERNFRMLDSVLKYQTVKLTDEVDPSTVTVDPEEVKFAGMDFTDEPEEEAAEGAAPAEGDGRPGYPEYEPEAAAAPAAAGAAPAKAADKPAEEAKAADKPAEEAKAADKPAEEAKAEEKPAEEAKAAEEPAEEAKAEEKPAEADPEKKEG